MILHNCQLIAPLLCLLSEGGKALCLMSYVCMLATYFCFPSKQCKGTFCHKYFTFTMISLFIFMETLDDLDIRSAHKQFLILQTPWRPGNGVTERRCHATRDVWRVTVPTCLPAPDSCHAASRGRLRPQCALGENNKGRKNHYLLSMLYPFLTLL